VISSAEGEKAGSVNVSALVAFYSGDLLYLYPSQFDLRAWLFAMTSLSAFRREN